MKTDTDVLPTDTAWWWRAREGTDHTSTAWNNCCRRLWVNWITYRSSTLMLLSTLFLVTREIRDTQKCEERESAKSGLWNNACLCVCVHEGGSVCRVMLTYQKLFRSSCADHRREASLGALPPRGHPHRCLLEPAVPLPLPWHCCQWYAPTHTHTHTHTTYTIWFIIHLHGQFNCSWQHKQT